MLKFIIIFIFGGGKTPSSSNSHDNVGENVALSNLTHGISTCGLWILYGGWRIVDVLVSSGRSRTYLEFLNNLNKRF